MMKLMLTCHLSLIAFLRMLFSISGHLGKVLCLPKKTKSALRLLPIDSVFNSLGMYFEGNYHFDMCLPMGCSISCAYFEKFPSILQWVVSFEAGYKRYITIP